MKASVRRARPLDVSVVARLLKLWHADSAIPYPAPQEGPLVAWALAVIGHGFSFLAECDGKVVGVLGLEPAAFPWTMAEDRWHLRAAFFFVHPKYRGGTGAADALIGAAAALHLDKGVPVAVGLMTGGADAAVRDRFVQSHGFVYAGGQFALGFGERQGQPGGDG